MKICIHPNVVKENVQDAIQIYISVKTQLHMVGSVNVVVVHILDHLIHILIMLEIIEGAIDYKSD